MSLARNQLRTPVSSDVSGDAESRGMLHTLPQVIDAQASDYGIHPFKRVEVDDADYTVQLEDSLVAVTALTVTRTVTLPDPTEVPAGKVITIKDESGSAAADPAITIATPNAETIDGAASDSIETAHGVVRVYSDGTNYFTI